MKKMIAVGALALTCTFVFASCSKEDIQPNVEFTKDNGNNGSSGHNSQSTGG